MNNGEDEHLDADHEILLNEQKNIYDRSDFIVDNSHSVGKEFVSLNLRLTDIQAISKASVNY